jgi:hypothetical protein
MQPASSGVPILYQPVGQTTWWITGYAEGSLEILSKVNHRLGLTCYFQVVVCQLPIEETRYIPSMSFPKC